MNVFNWMAKDLQWHVGSGRQVVVGVDPILWLEDDYTLSADILAFLREKNLVTLDRMQNFRYLNGDVYWIRGADFGFSGHYEWEWNNFFCRVDSVGYRLSNHRDIIKWMGNPSLGEVTAKYVYKTFIEFRNFCPQQWWWFKRFWKWKMPLKYKYFGWFTLKGKLKTWDNLVKIGWHGPSWCSLCKTNAETSNHLQVSCNFTRSIWRIICSALNIPLVWDSKNFDLCFLKWYRECKGYILLRVIISWFIWLTRNKAVFEDLIPHAHNTARNILSVYNSIYSEQEALIVRKIGSFGPQFNRPVLFFDGVAQDGMCDARGAIFLNDSRVKT